jgi:hypothetical protein
MHHLRGLSHIQLIPPFTDDHNISQESQPSSATRAGEPSSYAARPAPRTFEEFMAELQRIVGATRFGNGTGGEDVDGGGLMVDEELYEEVFGNLDAMGNG